MKNARTKNPTYYALADGYEFAAKREMGGWFSYRVHSTRGERLFSTRCKARSIQDVSEHALEELRGYLERKGMSLPTSATADVVAPYSVEPAPAGFTVKRGERVLGVMTEQEAHITARALNGVWLADSSMLKEPNKEG